MAIKPLGARVLVQPVEVGEQHLESGIILPEAQRERATYKGEVVAIGDEVSKVAVGDLVLITQYGGDRAFEGAEEFVILDEGDILATLDR